MKPDERAFLSAIASKPSTMTAGEVGLGLGIPPKRIQYILLKWSGKNWYDYGVSAWTGWLTESGREAALKP